MSTYRITKAVASLPAVLVPNTIYAVRVGTGFDLFVSDMTGAVAHALNGVAGTLLWSTEEF